MSRTASTSAASSYSSSGEAAAAAASPAGPLSWSSGPLGSSRLMKDFGDLRNEFDIWMWIREDANLVDPPKTEQHPLADGSIDLRPHHQLRKPLPPTRMDPLARDTATAGHARTCKEDDKDWTYSERKHSNLEELGGSEALGRGRRPVRFDSLLQSTVQKLNSPPLKPPEDLIHS